MWGDALRDVPYELLRCDRALEHDERLWHLTRLLIGAGNHGRVGDRGMRQQDRLQFRGRHLVTLVLDQLLEPIDDIEVAIVVRMADVSGMQPAIAVEDLLGRGAIVQVALHDLRSANPDLTVGARAERGSGCDVDDLALRAGNDGADRADLRPVDVVADRMRNGAGFGHAIALIDLAVQAPATRVGQRFVERAAPENTLVTDERSNWSIIGCLASAT